MTTPTFTPLHHGGSGPPLLLLHGFTDTWRTWELVLPSLEREFEVLAPTLAGHAGGPPLAGLDLAAEVERLLDGAGRIASTPAGRRRMTRDLTVNVEHLPAELLVHQLVGAAHCDATLPLIDHVERNGWPLDASRIDCPVRIVWGVEDRILPWPRAAERYRRELPDAELVALDAVGHAPQLDVPDVAAELIRTFP